MLDTLLFALNAILPILLLVMLGMVVRRLGPWDQPFFVKLNGLVFQVLLPTLLFYNVYNISSFSELNWGALIFCLACVALLVGLGFLVQLALVPDRAQKGVIWQCVFRSNYAIIGLPLAAALGGDAALGFAALVSAFSIPLFNIMAVVSLTFYLPGEQGKGHVRDVVRKIATNPLILGILLGLAVLLVRSLLPVGADGAPVFTVEKNLPFLYESIRSVARTASPIALIALGAQFDFDAVAALRRQICLGTVLRLLAAPALALTLAFLADRFTPLTIGINENPALVALFGTPVAVSSAVMTQSIGGDFQLANQLVVWTSIGSVATLFGIICLLRSLGLL